MISDLLGTWAGVGFGYAVFLVGRWCWWIFLAGWQQRDGAKPRS